MPSRSSSRYASSAAWRFPTVLTPRSSAELSRAAAIAARQAAAFLPGLDPSGANARSLRARVRARPAAALGPETRTTTRSTPAVRERRGATPLEDAMTTQRGARRHNARAALAARSPDRRTRRGETTRSRAREARLRRPASVLPRTRRASAMSTLIPAARRRVSRRAVSARAAWASTSTAQTAAGTVAVVRSPDQTAASVADDDAKETAPRRATSAASSARLEAGAASRTTGLYIGRSGQAMRPRSGWHP